MTQDYDELLRLASAATPGPWSTYTDFPDQGGAAKGAGVYAGPSVIDMPILVEGRPWSEQLVADVAYIAAASPDVILALLDKLDRLQVVLVAVDDLLDWPHTSRVAPSDSDYPALRAARAALADSEAPR